MEGYFYRNAGNPKVQVFDFVVRKGNSWGCRAGEGIEAGPWMTDLADSSGNLNRPVQVVGIGSKADADGFVACTGAFIAEV